MDHNHFFDILDDLEMAEPPETDPFDESISTELGALLGKSILFSFKKSSIKGPKSGKSSPRFLNREEYTWGMRWVFYSYRFRYRILTGLGEDCYHWSIPSSYSN